jgi:hypothetical protein
MRRSLAVLSPDVQIRIITRVSSLNKFAATSVKNQPNKTKLHAKSKIASQINAQFINVQF